ncbi:MAG: prepilin-type N-terminal cleavage/methylation domain-containing protein [Candidatus Atribacteria bacterium]|nr:prepilin-type N-terminal cleavage/methylation domain-containing protein [Candidatus Atribacteria bacterium]
MLRIKRILTQSPKGMTLIELMIAVFILALVAMGLFRGFTVAFQAMADAKDRTMATNYAQQILESYKNTPFEKILPSSGSIEGTKFFKNVSVNQIDESLKKVITRISWADRNSDDADKRVVVETSIADTRVTAQENATPAGIIIYASSYNLLPGNDPENRDRPSHIWAKIVDEHGNLIIDWDEEKVLFTIESEVGLDNEPVYDTLGGFTPAYFNELLSDIRDGVAETDFYQYQAEERQGYVTIKASLTVGAEELYDTLRLKITNEAVAVVLSSEGNKHIISTEGGEEGIAHLIAKIVDAAGDIVTTENRPVTFEIISGPETSSLINMIPTENGIAKIDLKAGSLTGSNTVLAMLIPLEPGSITIQVVDPGIHNFKIVAPAPNTKIAQLGSVEIVARLTDYLGEPISGNIINFAIEDGSHLGSISRSSDTTGEAGNATTELTMNYAGTATIKAYWIDEENNEIYDTIQIVCGNHWLYVEADPLNVYEGHSSTIRAALTNVFGAPVPSQYINFSVKEGDATLSPLSALTDEEGIATVTLTANEPGDIIVRAEWQEDLQNVFGEVEVSCINAPIYQVQLSAPKTTISAGESLELTAAVTENGNPVNGITVTFTVSGSADAKLDNQAPSISKDTDEDGIATVTLSGLNPGESATITAEAGDSSDSITISCEVPEIAIRLNPAYNPRLQGNKQVYFGIIVENDDINLNKMKISWSPASNEGLKEVWIDDTQVYLSGISGGSANGTEISFNVAPYSYQLEKDRSYVIKMVFIVNGNMKKKHWNIEFFNPENNAPIVPAIEFYLKG